MGSCSITAPHAQPLSLLCLSQLIMTRRNPLPPHFVLEHKRASRQLELMQLYLSRWSHWAEGVKPLNLNKEVRGSKQALEIPKSSSFRLCAPSVICKFNNYINKAVAKCQLYASKLFNLPETKIKPSYRLLSILCLKRACNCDPRSISRDCNLRVSLFSM